MITWTYTHSVADNYDRSTNFINSDQHYERYENEHRYMNRVMRRWDTNAKKLKVFSSVASFWKNLKSRNKLKFTNHIGNHGLFHASDHSRTYRTGKVCWETGPCSFMICTSACWPDWAKTGPSMKAVNERLKCPRLHLTSPLTDLSSPLSQCATQKKISTNGRGWNLYIKTTLGTNKMWSLYAGGLYMQVQ